MKPLNQNAWKNNKYLLPRHFQPQLMKNAVEYCNFLFEYSTAQHSAVQHSTHSTVQHRTVQCSTEQHSAAQHTLKTHLNDITVEFK
jgi:hypothetical protein